MNEVLIDRPGLMLVVEYHAQAVIQPDIDGFVAGLHAMLDGGAQFRAGQTFRMGWSTLRFVDIGGGCIAFEELDGSGVPNQWTRGVSRTLIATRLQTAVHHSFELPDDALEFPSLAHSALACRALDPDGALLLHRADPVSETDTGWFFGCRRADHDHEDPANLVADSLYAHACRVQAVLPFVALPAGTVVLLAADGAVDEAYDAGGVPLAVTPGSYLAQRRGRTSRV